MVPGQQKRLGSFCAEAGTARIRVSTHWDSPLFSAIISACVHLLLRSGLCFSRCTQGMLMRTERQPGVVSNPMIPEAVRASPNSSRRKFQGGSQKAYGQHSVQWLHNQKISPLIKTNPYHRVGSAPRSHPRTWPQTVDKGQIDAWPCCLMLPAANCHLGPTTLTFLNSLWPGKPLNPTISG